MALSPRLSTNHSQIVLSFLSAGPRGLLPFYYFYYYFYSLASDTRSPEYFIVGHDKSLSAFSGHFTGEQGKLLGNAEGISLEKRNKLLHESILQTSNRIHMDSPQQHYAFLFGGIGDARHLFVSLADMNDFCPSPTTKRFHFTMVDINSAVIARDLVMFYIFKQLSQFSLEQMQQDIAAIEVLRNSSITLSFLHSLLFYHSHICIIFFHRFWLWHTLHTLA
jgi:hypothetical protein